MQWIQTIIFMLLLSSFFTPFDTRFIDLLNPLAAGRKNTLNDDIDVLLGKPAKGFFNRESVGVEQFLKSTGRENRFTMVRRIPVLLSSLEAVVSLLLNNPSPIPILSAGFAPAPVWYLCVTASACKKHLSEELETVISVVTTSYLRSGDLMKAVKENIPYLDPPVKGNSEAFITEAEMLNANTISAISSLKMKIPNRIFHEWCNILIQCQPDRNMMSTLTPTVQRSSDMRIVQTELEATINEPKREVLAMMFLVLYNVPLLYVLSQNWLETLTSTLPGKITLAICAIVILFSFTRIMQLSKPIEYKG